MLPLFRFMQIGLVAYLGCHSAHQLVCLRMLWQSNCETFKQAYIILAFPDACLKSCSSVLSAILMRYLKLVYKFGKHNLASLCLDFGYYFIMCVLRVLDAVEKIEKLHLSPPTVLVDKIGKEIKQN